jgi:hypothetical protein
MKVQKNLLVTDGTAHWRLWFFSITEFTKKSLMELVSFLEIFGLKV